MMDRCAMPMSEATAAMVVVDGVNDGLAVGSLKIIASVISVAHTLAKADDPTETEAFRSVMRGIGRLLTHQQDRKVALNADELLQIREACDADPNRARGRRDWALVAFGFAGAFRRSEIVARNHADIEYVGDELRVYLDRSKTDQFGRGAYVTIKSGANPKLCPLRALAEWTAIAPGPGPLFRPISKHGGVLHRRLSVFSVTGIVKGFGVVLDLPEDRLGAHSLRAGMVTALLQSGLGEIQTMQHSRHKSADTLGRYFRPRGSSPNFTTMAGL
jgi:integrase